jgi:hypothetical protein
MLFLLQPCCSFSVDFIPTRATQCVCLLLCTGEGGGAGLFLQQGSGQGVKLSTHFLEVLTSTQA